MDTKDKTKPNRRAVLAKLGLAAGAAYVAPAMLSLSPAYASSGSAPSRGSAPSGYSAPSRPSGGGGGSSSRYSRPSWPANNNRRRLTLQQWLNQFFR